MIDFIKEIDKSVFIFLNGINSPFFDWLMFYISESWTWFPVFVILLYASIKKFGIKILWILIFIAVLITLTDQSSVKLFKNVFLRYRPCHNLELHGIVHTVNDKCGAQYGFVSSHASNYFGLASFFIIILGIKRKIFLFLIILWAVLIGYSRIYLGVHYPADVLAGAILGSAIGLIWAKITLTLVQKLPPKNNIYQ